MTLSATLVQVLADANGDFWLDAYPPEGAG
jgi:hypothetical protein